jgi:hypothetical protein
MPLVDPLPADHDPEVARLATFFNQTLGFPPNSVLTMLRRPALARAFTELNRAVMENHGRVTSELKRLVGHVASTGSVSPEASLQPTAGRPRGASATAPPWR